MNCDANDENNCKECEYDPNRTNMGKTCTSLCQTINFRLDGTTDWRELYIAKKCYRNESSICPGMCRQHAKQWGFNEYWKALSEESEKLTILFLYIKNKSNGMKEDDDFKCMFDEFTEFLYKNEIQLYELYEILFNTLGLLQNFNVFFYRFYFFQKFYQIYINEIDTYVNIEKGENMDQFKSNNYMFILKIMKDVHKSLNRLQNQGTEISEITETMRLNMKFIIISILTDKIFDFLFNVFWEKNTLQQLPSLSDQWKSEWENSISDVVKNDIFDKILYEQILHIIEALSKERFENSRYEFDIKSIIEDMEACRLRRSQ
jgi:hypothetical protein